MWKMLLKVLIMLFKEIIAVYILRINYRDFCKNIYNYILRIANPEHFVTL